MDSKIQHACHPDSITMQIPTEWLSAVGELERLKSFVQRNKVSTSIAKNGCNMKSMMASGRA
ncbi:hypothetical protein J1N35_020738 [Gossypium stocksii]|uniref:Uncharacterized protein n=1 Tax=Gossypium stocksii TaxID=47602 RepID=A0A9D4A162_9ROSI|nr:hypothetical protein J1N35_020738 [Gossypium stocksii]